MDTPFSEVIKNSSEDYIREILDYSFQKDDYQGERAAGNYLIAYTVEKARSLRYQKNKKNNDKKNR